MVKRRYNYTGLARVIGRAKAFERPDRDIERKIQSPNAVDPMIDLVSNVREMRNLSRSHIARKDDIGFDILLEELTPPEAGSDPSTWLFALGNPINVPVGQIMVIQQYLFFAQIDNTPADPEYILANPLELKRIFQFHIKENGVSLQRNYYDGGFAYPVGGYTILSNSLANDSDWQNAGNSLIAQGGSKVIVQGERVTNLVPARRVASVGARIRGFFTQQTGEEGVQK